MIYAAAVQPTTAQRHLTSLWRSVSLAEERTSADAEASGLLACAPRPVGALGGAQS